MSNYRFVYQKKVEKTPNEPVSISEFKVFSNGQESIMITKIHNESDEKLLEATFEVIELDEAALALNKSTYTFKHLSIEANSSAVPELKIKADPLVYTIKVRLIQAVTTNNTWASGLWQMPTQIKPQAPVKVGLVIKKKTRPKFVLPIWSSFFFVILFTALVILIYMWLNPANG